MSKSCPAAMGVSSADDRDLLGRTSYSRAKETRKIGEGPACLEASEAEGSVTVWLSGCPDAKARKFSNFAGAERFRAFAKLQTALNSSLQRGLIDGPVLRRTSADADEEFIT